MLGFLPQLSLDVVGLFGGTRDPAPAAPEAPRETTRPPPLAPDPTAPDPKRMSRLADQLFQAMDGLGTDEKAIFSALRGRSPAEIAEIKKIYLVHYGRSLDSELDSELSGGDLDTARAALSGDPVKAAAAALDNASRGLGTDSDTIIDTLHALPDPEQRRKVAVEFERRTGTSLGAMLDDELSGSLRRQALDLANGNVAEADAERLDDSLHGLFGADEKSVAAALEQCKTREQRQALQEAYQRRTGRQLDSDLGANLSGADLSLATALSRGDAAGAAAVRLHQAADGLGTDEAAMREALRDVITPAEARAVRDTYQRAYGQDLDAVLADELSGKEQRQIELMLPKEPGPMFGTPEFEAALDKASGSKATAGNQANMLFDGVNSFAERFRLIDEAKSSINLQTFIFTDDDTGWQLAIKLAEKAQQGVQVRLIYDGLGSNRSDPAIFELMRHAGVDVRAYAKPTEDPLDLNSRWHEKHFQVDGQVSIEGGMNIADEYAYGGTDKKVRGGAEAWRDCDVEIRGPAVVDAEKAFLNNWNQLGAPVDAADEKALLGAPCAAAGNAGVRVIQHAAHEKDDNIENTYLQCVRSARTSITIENAYFLPSPELRQALMEAAARGVKVRVMTNSRQSNDNHMVADASRSMDDELVAAGVEFHEKEGGTLHAKTAAFDGAYSLVGSANLNGRSREHDSEVVLGISDAGVAQQIEQRFDKGLDKTQEVTAADLRDESVVTDVRQSALSLFSGVF